MNTIQRIMQLNYRDERGVVSLFIVIFAAILMSIITVSFTLTVLRGQQQATQSDLSRSAYDSAMAGVEDAKRALAYCATSTSPACQKLNNNDAKENCYVLRDVGIGIDTTTDGQGNEEFQLQRTEGGGENTLNQAYTCVTIDSAPSDYQADLTRDAPFLLPIQAEGKADRIDFTWSTKMAGGSATSNLPPFTAVPNLYSLERWNQSDLDYPPVMRVQLIRLESSGRVASYSDFDGNKSQTLFLYPSRSGTSSANFSTDNRRKPKPASTPIQVRCTGTECAARLTTDSAITAGSNLDAFLLITPIYKDASITVNLRNGDQSVGFSKVQSVVDSTGRANDLFRRVSARVNLTPNIAYPNAALSLEGPLCKNFAVTSNGTLNNTCVWQP